MLLIYLFFILSSQVLITESAFVWCDGQMCRDNCTAMACRLCNSDNCNAGSNCHCASTSIPGGLSISQTPQFVLMTFEGPIKSQFFTVTDFESKVLRNSNITDSHGCLIKPTFYVQNDYSDYNYMAYVGMIGSLGLNSITGKLSQGSTQRHWSTEYLKGKEMIYNYSKTSYEIVSARAANGQFCTKYFDILESTNIKLDSSIAENPFFNISYDVQRFQTQRIWPYTLDYGFHKQGLCSNITTNVTQDISCINNTYPGIWEFVQTVLNDENGDTYDLNWVCEENYTSALTLLKNNFDDNYNKNRSPFILNISSIWLLPEGDAEVNTIRLKFIQEAYQYMGNHTNVLFATEDRIMNWINNPLPYADTINMHEFDCINMTVSEAYWSESLLCDFPASVGAFYFNTQTCPEYYPNITNSICDEDQTCHKDIDDCNCQYCDPCVNNWPGDIYWNYTREWSAGVCGRIIIANHFNYKVKSAIITLRLYNSYATHIWGANYVRINSTVFPCKSESWRIVPYLRDYFIDTTYSYIGLCIHKGADFQRNLVRLGVEFSTSYPQTNSLKDWTVYSCGDGVCTNDELGTKNKSLSCAADCLPDILYSILLFVRNLEVFKFLVFGFLLIVLLLVQN